MASLLLPPPSLLSSRHSSVPPPPPPPPSSPHRSFLCPQVRSLRKSLRRRRFFIPAAASVLDESSVFDPFQEPEDAVTSLKLKLLELPGTSHQFTSTPLRCPESPQKRMASLLLPPPSLLSSRHSSVPPPPPPPSSPHRSFLCPQVRSLRKSLRRRRFFIPAAASVLDESSVVDPFQEPEDAVTPLKLKLLSSVSGLNRGLAAGEEDLKRAESAAKDLESAGGVVDLAKNLDKLQGRWKLIYSSAFSSGTLGGSRPGPPTGRLIPITLGQVFQRIDVVCNDFDNIVELQFGTPWPLPQIEATATLAHKFEIIGNSNVKITFIKTTVKPTGSYSQIPSIEVPRLPDGLRPPSNTGSGEFEVTYMDGDTRITRGDRGELRVFVMS